MLALCASSVLGVGVQSGASVFANVGAASPAAAATSRSLAYRKLGASDLLVSEVCLGGMTWGSQTDDAEAAEQLSLAWDMGVNFFDTAEAYPVPLARETFGSTDRVFARWRRTSKMPRDRCIISTKVRRSLAAAISSAFHAVCSGYLAGEAAAADLCETQLAARASA